MKFVQIVIRTQNLHEGRVLSKDELVYAKEGDTVRDLYRYIPKVKSIFLYDREKNSSREIGKESKLESNATYLINSWEGEETRRYLKFIINRRGRKLCRNRR